MAGPISNRTVFRRYRRLGLVVLATCLSASTGQYLRDRSAVAEQRPQLASWWLGLAGSYPLSVIRAVAECRRHIRLTARTSICSKILEFVIMVAVTSIMFIDRPNIQLEFKTLRERIMPTVEYLMVVFIISARVSSNSLVDGYTIRPLAFA
jgi:hypothetical protein